MCIREKINKSSTTSIVINKNRGKYKGIKSFGVGRSKDEVINLRKQAESWMNFNGGSCYSILMKCRTVCANGLEMKHIDISIHLSAVGV